MNFVRGISCHQTYFATLDDPVEEITSNPTKFGLLVIMPRAFEQRRKMVEVWLIMNLNTNIGEKITERLKGGSGLI